MIKNLIVNGCSYTEDTLEKSWARNVYDHFIFDHYTNLAVGGAGNFYISNSTIDYLESTDLSPEETLVIIMWSGPGRKDIRISGEWYYYFDNQYSWKAKSFNGNESEYYLFSGGMSNTWMANLETKKIFTWAYKLSDPTTLCKDTLTYILSLENYLKSHGYNYRFSSFVNYWSTTQEYNQLTGDYSIDFFLKDIPMYQHYDFDSWMFIDYERNCLGEFAQNLNELDKTVHPTARAHQQFSKEIIIPHLTDSYAELLVPHS